MGSKYTTLHPHVHAVMSRDIQKYTAHDAIPKSQQAVDSGKAPLNYTLNVRMKRRSPCSSFHIILVDIRSIFGELVGRSLNQFPLSRAKFLDIL